MGSHLVEIVLELEEPINYLCLMLFDEKAYRGIGACDRSHRMTCFSPDMSGILILLTMECSNTSNTGIDPGH